MSQLFDSLRGGRRETAPAQQAARRSRKGDAVLATLGYTPARRGAGVSPKRLIVVVVIAVAGWFGWNQYVKWTSSPPPSDARRMPATPRQAQTRPPAPIPPSPVPQTQANPTPPATTRPPSTTSPTTTTPPMTTTTPPVTTTTTPAAHNVVPAPKPAPPVIPQPRSNPSSTGEVARREPPRRNPPAVNLPPREALPVVTPRPDRSTSTPTEDVDHWSRALYYHRDGDFEKAMQHYQALLAKDDMNVQVRNNLGLLYQDKGLIDEAIREFRRAINIDPRYGPAHNNLGVALLRQGNADGAAAEFRAAIEIDSHNVDAIINRALAEKALGQRENAKAGLLRALVMEPRNPAAHYNIALLYEDSGEAALAIRHYRSFLDNARAEHAVRAAEVRARLDALMKRTVQ